MKELIIDATIDNLDEVLDFINAELEEKNCPLKLQTQIDIAVEEIFANIANYAYNPDVGGAVIRISTGDDIVIEFEDKGKPYNPLEKIDPDIEKHAAERQVGGLGVFMVKQIMDMVEYEHVGNKNILIIKKVVG